MSTAAIVLPLLAAACFGLVGPAAATRLPPPHATWLLSVGAVIAALSALAVFGLLGFVLVGQVPDLASHAHWSASALRANAPTEPGVGAISLLVALAAAVAVLFVALRRGLEVLSAYRACKSMATVSGQLVVVKEAAAGAIAVPGRPGRIVVAQSLLAALSGPERRAVLAHERAHLKHGHHWHLAAVSIAAAANPLVAPLRGAALRAAERWADEEAAAEIGDRPGVAAAIAQAALLTRRGPVPAGPQLAAAVSALPERISALLQPAPRPRPVLSFLLIALLLLGALATAVVAKEVEHLFELAGRVYRGTHGS